MKKITAQYEISRTAAILAGKSEFGTVVVTVDPSTLAEAQRAELIACPMRGDNYDLMGLVGGRYSTDDHPTLPEFYEATEDAVAALLDARTAIRTWRAERDAERKRRFAAETENSITAALATPLSELLTIDRRVTEAVGESTATWNRVGRRPSLRLPGDDLRVIELYAMLDAEADRLNTEAQADAIARAATREAKAARRSHRIAEWVTARRHV